MQPTENKQPVQEELIAHVRRSLKAHEDPYNLGAWENFNEKQQNNRTPVFWMTRLGGVAAVIAVCFSLFFLMKSNPEHASNVLVKAKPNQTIEELQDAISNGNLDKLEHNSAKTQTQNGVIGSETSTQLIVKNHTFEVKNIGDLTDHPKGIEDNQPTRQSQFEAQTKDVVDQKSAEKFAVISEDNIKPNTVDFLIKEAQRNESAPEKMTKNNGKSKWVLGLMIAPSLGNAEELNMGYGISMGYNFSDKLSLVTGVSYNEMSASKDFTGSIGMSSILYGNNKSLAAISQRVTGLDIPLELKYSFNKNVYASVGVSAFAVIGQSRSNTFIQGVVVSGTTGKTSSSATTSSPSDLSSAKGQFENTFILNKKVVESADLQGQNNVDYLGFYNVSFGYKKKVLKRHFVAFEPFVKLPVKQVTQDDLRLVGAGLRLKVDF